MRIARKRPTEGTAEDIGLTAKVLVRPNQVEEEATLLERIFQTEQLHESDSSFRRSRKNCKNKNFCEANG